MNKGLTAVLLMVMSLPALADKGTVTKVDICGSGNTIIETNDGWYIAAEHYGGTYFYEGDVVFGTMKTYGMQELTRSDGATANFYIEDYETSLGDALEELCE